jgi:hypothetical protein
VELTLANLLGNVAFGTAFFVALLNTIDWLLTKNQKKWLSDKAISVWVWLDDNRSIDFLRRFKDYREQVKSSAIIQAFMTIAFLPAAILGGREEAPLQWAAIGGILVAPATIFLIHPAILRWITQPKTSLGYFVRSTISVLPIVLGLYVFNDDINAIFAHGLARSFLRVTTEVATGRAVLLGMFMAVASTILFFWYVNVVLFGAWALSVLLFGISRFVRVRVAENKKGVVYGLSALFAIVGALAKSLLDK